VYGLAYVQTVQIRHGNQNLPELINKVSCMGFHAWDGQNIADPGEYRWGRGGTLFEQRAGNDQLFDFLGAFAALRDLGVPTQAL
jgi:hypothetical protein